MMGLKDILERYRAGIPDRVREITATWPIGELESVQDWTDRISDRDADAAEYIQAYSQGIDTADGLADRDRRRRREEVDEQDRNTGYLYDIPRWEIPGYGAGAQTFSSFETLNNQRLCEIYLAVTAFARSEGAHILTLAGPTGTGKTHLLRAAARGIENTTGTLVLYVNETDLIGWAGDAMHSNRLDSFTDEVTLVPWLFLDELGLNRLNTFSGAFMDRVFTVRHEARKRTMVTTNLQEKALPPRIVSRLLDTKTSRMLQFGDVLDYRRAQ